jgi:hypothetical protein
VAVRLALAGGLRRLPLSSVRQGREPMNAVTAADFGNS